MKKIAIIVIFAVALLLGGFLGFIITGFTTAGSTQESFNFYYEPSSPAPIEEFLVNVDVGGVEIQYNTSNTPYYAKVEVSIAISGLFMAGKSYLDFLTPYTEWWDNSSSPASFNMNVIPDVWFDPSHWFKSYNIDIKVTLRTDLIYDITAHIITGSLKMNVPENIVLNRTLLRTTTGEVLVNTSSNTKFQGELNVQTTTGKASIIGRHTNYTNGFDSGTATGSLLLSLDNCIFGEDLTGIVTTGSITYNTDNITFTEDSSILLQTSTGSIIGNINQHLNLGANITGTMEVVTGGIDITYINNMSALGARFSSTVTTGNINYVYDPIEFSRINGVLTSSNYNSTIYKYTFTLSTVTGNIDVEAESNHL